MLKKFEKIIIVSLIVMMVLVVLISTIELAVLIIKDIIEPPRYWLGIEQLFEIFGFFLMLLIGVELLETIKAYLSENVVHSEIVLEVALIAISRKVITLDVKTYEPLTLLGIAALIVSIGLAYFFIKKCRSNIGMIGGSSEQKGIDHQDG
ncbi:MAG: phosphate-starvation-inducible E-like protein [Desulfobacteraceae bacterium]|nr:MAG: phosphate-starvation-inducible E-like protein [Desulfobacteraceae bacterium]